MVKVALRGMATRRLRTALTALAIVLGVGMVAAAFTVGDTMRQGADSLSASAYDGTDAVVSAPSAFKTDSRRRDRHDPGVDARPRAVGARRGRRRRRRPPGGAADRQGRQGASATARTSAMGYDASSPGQPAAEPDPPQGRPLGDRARRGRDRRRHGPQEALRRRRRHRHRRARPAPRRIDRRHRRASATSRRSARRRSPSST